MIGGITSNLYQSQMVNRSQQMHTAFQKLGSDLQSGNISAAQQDFATLTQTVPSSTSGSNSISQRFTQLGKDIQSGNLSAAQQDFISIQSAAQQAHTHHGRHHTANSQSSPTDRPSTDPLGILSNLVSTAASSYLGPASALSAGSILSAMI